MVWAKNHRPPVATGPNVSRERSAVASRISPSISRTLVLRDQRDRAAHALAGQVERHAGILGAQQRDHRLGVVDQGLGAGPAAARRAAAEAALVVGIGGDAVLGPDLRRLVPRLAIVAEAVQAQDHRLGLAVGGRPDGDR